MNQKANVATALLVLTASSALADDLHYNNILIGDRASGFGGAYTAVSDDPAGLYYNPAGIVYAGGRNLSASVNAYHVTNTVYKNVVSGNDFNRKSSNLLPNFFGFTQPLGPGVIGFSYAVTDSVLEDQDQVFRNFGGADTYYINVNNKDSTNKIGPSYAIALSDSLAIGATIYAHLRSLETIQNHWVRPTDGSNEWSNSYFQSDETGLEPVVGVMWSPVDKLSVGLTLRKPTIISADTTWQETLNMLEPSLASSDEKRDLPLTTTLGLAYFPTDSLLLSADLSHYEATEDFFQKRSETWNGAIGMEYYVSGQFALRMGLFTNNANTPEIEPGMRSQLDHVNFQGASLSLSRFTRNSSLTVGISYQQGRGDAQLLSGEEAGLLIQKVESSSVTTFLSTSYTY